MQFRLASVRVKTKIMKIVMILGVALLLAFAVNADDNGDSKYESVDVDAILGNPRVLTNYIKCLMDQGSCTKEGRQLKKDLPDAIESNCGKCTDNQKNIVRKACNHIKAKRPEDWKKLTGKYDPSGSHVQSFDQFLSES